MFGAHGRRGRVHLGGAALLVVVALALSACTPTPIALQGTLDVAGAPDTNVQVAVYTADAPTLVAQTRTIHGAFSFTADELAPGTYRVRFGDDQWYADATSWADATEVTVGADGTVTLDAQATIEPATITGYGVSSGRCLPEASATIFAAGTGAVVAAGTSSYCTPFAIDVPPGSYLVSAGGLWNGQLAHHDAVPMTVTAGQSVDLGGLESRGAATWTVRGTVADAGGPLRDVDVYLYEAEGHFVVMHLRTGSDGTFSALVNPTVDLQALVVDTSGAHLPVTWGSTTVGGPGTDTFSIPLQPIPGQLDLGTQVLDPAT